MVTQPDDAMPVGNIGALGPLPGAAMPAPAAPASSAPAGGVGAPAPAAPGSPAVPAPVVPGATSGVALDDPSCGSFSAPRASVLTPIAPELPGLLNSLTLSQKVDALHGGPCCNVNFDCNFNGMDSGSFVETGLPSFKMRDGPRGVHGLDGEIATTWAVAMARAASFDLNMEERVGQLQGVEMQALKHDLSLAPTVNTLRHPGWARAQETYGEDPVLLGEMGAAFVRGMQQTTPACVKHFAVNNTDENRRIVSSNLVEQTLRENYTRAFKIVIEKSDPTCVMAAYNLVNGIPSTQNTHLLTDILRDDWGWTGFVLSDWWSTAANQGQAVMNAGLDLEMPGDCAFNVLDGAVQEGSVQSDRINQAAERILNVRQKFGQLDPAYRSTPSNAAISSTPAHQQLALETSEKSTVLLQNDGVLPIAAGATVAIVGPDAHLPSQIDENQTAGPPDGLGDRGSSEVNEPYAISIAAGMQEAGAVVTVGTEAADAAGADVVIVPVAMQHLDEGEAFGGGGDRDDLTLSGQHPVHWRGTTPAAFISQVAAVNPNVVLVLMVGSAIIQEEWMAQARAIVQPFYPGQEGGRAIARLLTGQVNFSAKLPFTVATNVASYPAPAPTKYTTDEQTNRWRYVRPASLCIGPGVGVRATRFRSTSDRDATTAAATLSCPWLLGRFFSKQCSAGLGRQHGGGHWLRCLRFCEQSLSPQDFHDFRGRMVFGPTFRVDLGADYRLELRGEAVLWVRDRFDIFQINTGDVWARVGNDFRNIQVGRFFGW